MHYIVRPSNNDDQDECERILRSLPEWFGIEEATAAYVAAVGVMETWVLELEERVVGFLSIEQHNEHSAEIHVMAIEPEHHGQGCGRQLVEVAEAVLRSRSIAFLEVKTLAPSRECEFYERTRNFYRAMGFQPLEENALWGAETPCLILVKHLSCFPTSPTPRRLDQPPPVS